MDKVNFSAEIQSKMVVRLSEIVLLEFTVCISSIDVNTWISRHKSNGLIHDGHSLVMTALLEETDSHIVVSQTNLDSYIILEALGKHEFTGSFEIRKGLVLVF